MKDSQDWLDEIIQEILLVDNAALYELGGSGAIAVEDLKRVKNKYIKRCRQEIRKHILQEIENEIEDFCEQVQDKANTVPPNLLLNEVVSIKWDKLSELRNKFNDKYKEE